VKVLPSFEHAYSKSELRPLGLEHTATPVHCDSLDAPTGLVGLDVGQSKHVFVLNAPIVVEYLPAVQEMHSDKLFADVVVR
jgi:hypothetical protein